MQHTRPTVRPSEVFILEIQIDLFIAKKYLIKIIFFQYLQRQAGHTSQSMYHLHISLTDRVWCPVEEKIDFFSPHMINKSQCYHQEQKNQYLPIQEKTLRKQQSNILQAISRFFTCTSETSI